MATAATSTTSSTLSLAGLASGFDWKTFVSSIISADSIPIQTLQNTESTNKSKLSAYDAFSTLVKSLQTSAKALGSSTLFSGTTATSSNTTSSWIPGSSSSTPPGTYAIAVSQLATNTLLKGTVDVGAGLSATSDVSGVTIGSMRTASPVTAGFFTVNGQQVTVAATDSLQDVFAKIATATGNAVTASYDPTTDKMSLNSATPIVLGAANDTSNFLSVAKLSNNSSGTITSGSALGNINPTATLANGGLRNAVTAVDGTGNGTFSINGVAIAYNVNTDSLSTVMGKINASSAGVTASYDAANDRMVLTNKITGNTGLTTTEAAGGLLGALGVTTGALTYGQDANYTVNGGPTLVSASNTLDSTSSGIPGLSVTVNSNTAETINVATNTTAMTAAVNDFISKYNQVQSYIDSQTKTTSSNGTVTTSLLSGDREIQGWGSTFRSRAFSSVSSSSGAVQRLADLGIDFAAGTDQLSVVDSSKLQSALSSHPSDVAAFFGATNTGFAAQISSYADTILGTGSGGTGLLNATESSLNAANKSIDLQISHMQAQITAEQNTLTAGFEAMESAESTIQNQAAQLTKMFGTTSSSG